MRSDQRKTPADASSSQRSRSRTDARRRGFLLALGVGGAAALAARSLTGSVPQGDGAADAGESKGYQVTDHVRRYYGTAKL